MSAYWCIELVLFININFCFNCHVRRSWKEWYLSPMNHQFVIIHAIYQTYFCITRQVDYKHTFFQNVSTKKNACPCIVLKNNLFVCPVGMGQVLFLSAVKVCIGGLQQIAVLWGCYVPQLLFKLIYRWMNFQSST
jgi:hypothetical protein